MERRKFLRNGGLLGIGTTVLSPYDLFHGTQHQLLNAPEKTAKNIIFLVSDGMSTGTLTMANMLLERKENRTSEWMKMLQQHEAKRALMDTASADSLVTDSAAAGSAWGGGVRINNGAINMGPNGEKYKPILQKFKNEGKAVGCVSTVPITHATPASFCINIDARKKQAEIAELYLDLQFDVMLGGGLEYFSGELREDKKDLFKQYKKKNYNVARNKSELMKAAGKKAPVMGVFHENGLPYSADHKQDEDLQKDIPTLKEMTRFAIDQMKGNPNGFAMQVEGGKVDWAAHGNDIGGLLYDQVAFDDAVGEALSFAKEDKETLVIVTTDHGNANPGLFSDEKATENFDRLFGLKHSNEWILKGLKTDSTNSQIIERIEHAMGSAITTEEAGIIQEHLSKMDDDGSYNPYKLPFKELAQLQSKYTSIGWASQHHTADYVELTMMGPGSEMLRPFVKNNELHDFMLVAAGVKK